MTRPKIVIFNDTHGWHSQQMQTAFDALDIDVVLADLADCRIDLDSATGLYIPEFEHTLPDAVMVRGIAPGSFEQITLRMDVLHTLAELGVPVFNSAKAIEHTVDKARTSLRLHLAGLNTPKTWACENKQLAYDIAQAEFNVGHALIIKPLFGCQGKGIAKLNTIGDLNNYVPVGDAFYLQRYVPPFTENDWQDWRLFVIDNQVCAAMSRRSNHWITNFAQGAQVFATTVSQEMETLAIKATQAVNADYAGVDLIRQADGNYSVLEVNSVPAWKGLYQATNINVAADLAQALVNRINAKNKQSQSSSC
jgi:RimK family alpha-L-glutamate ligase